MTRTTRKVVMATVPARNRGPELNARTSVAVAEVGRQRLASNKLARSAPKRVAVRVNRGLGGAASDLRATRRGVERNVGVSA